MLDNHAIQMPASALTQLASIQERRREGHSNAYAS